MKNVQLIITLLLLTHGLNAQKSVAKPVNEYAITDKRALQIPDSLTRTTEAIAGYVNSNFTTDKEKVRAIFIWVVTNIQYDVENMYAINFYEQKADKIARALKARKGICGNYAELFNDICLNANLKSYVIEGYTKQNGFADYIAHAWCAALIDNTWFMFDPTWGSGYIINNKFYKRVNDTYFKVPPSSLLKSHMPFDYLWQFVKYPVTNQEFYEGTTSQNNLKAFFNFNDSIVVYNKQSHIDQLTSSARRIEANGLKNSLIFDRLQHIKLEIENYKNSQTVGLYNNAALDYNAAINSFNEFIEYRNKQFVPLKSDAEIQTSIDKVNEKLSDAKTKLIQIKDADSNLNLLIVQLNKSIDDAAAHVKDQQNWLKVYFSKSKSGRKSMFYEKKLTWFGIPL